MTSPIESCTVTLVCYRGTNRKVQNKELELENRIQKSTTGVRVHDRVLSETIRLLLGRWLRLWDLRNLRVRIYYTGLWGMWVIVRSWWGWLGHHGRLLSRGVRGGYSTAGVWSSETRGSEVWVLKCFCGCNALCGVELKEAFE